MLLGTWDLPADQRARLALPPPFAAAARAGLTVTRGFDRCLHAFPHRAWDQLAARVAALPLGAPAARHVRRLIFGAAAHLAPDDAGAISIPPPLLAYAEIDGPAVLVGMETYFEIWAPALWQAHHDQLSAALHTWRSSELPAALGAI
jgi:MraZ protein